MPASKPLAAIAVVERLVTALRGVKTGPCGDGTAHRWAQLKAEIVDDRYSLISRECLACRYWTGAMRERTAQEVTTPSQGTGTAIQPALSAQASESASMSSNTDKAIALIDAINRLRLVKESLNVLELPGAADDVAQAQHGLQRKLRILQEEGVGRLELPRELIFG